MASLRSFQALFFLSVLFICFSEGSSSTTEGDKKVYVVYMGACPSKLNYSPMSHHQNILQEVLGSRYTKGSLVYSYGRSFNGFAATLSEEESKKLAGMDGVVSVFPSENYKYMTTRSYDFMGLTDDIQHNQEMETNTIVGIIDSGIWPESPSFSDEGLGPVPQKWKGVCDGGTNFTCNKKLIGARYYVEDTARDFEGHGTHTASTAAGSKVPGASFFGLAQGTARGGVPSGRIAAYRVCGPRGCDGAGMMKAFDDAIADGVDIISVSLGGGVTTFDKSAITLGAFHGMQKGVLVVAAVGNAGTDLKKADNLAPWMLTVGASNSDRKLVTKVVTGDGQTIIGTSANDADLKGKNYPLVYGKTLSSKCDEAVARGCAEECLAEGKGKIILCDGNFDVNKAKNAGVVGVILHIETDSAGVVALPLSVMADSEYQSLVSYVTSNENPVGTILKSESMKDTNAPRVASFSSRGPNVLAADILKPDIIAPGVNILASYYPLAQVTPDPDDKRQADFHFETGTSMACPHVAGAAAYIKSIHPDWSSSAIQSSIMTSAWPMNASVNDGGEFAYGSGHINPANAIDPGLLYEANDDDYLAFLCALKYSSEALKILSGKDFDCAKLSNPSVRDLNYPSMTAQVSPSSSSEITFKRTVTNVGAANSVYKAQITGDPKLSVKVEPDTLSFGEEKEKKSFTVTVSANDISGLVSASLVWSDGSHVVRSPIVIYS